MDKKAKILATLGPSIFKKNIINQLIRSGVDGFRINFSHNLTGIEKIVKIIRDCEKLNAKPIAIVADLQGIKLRIGKILENQVSLKKGDTFNFDLNKKIGSQSRVYLPYPEIFKKIKKSNKILIDDGKFVFKIKKLTKNSIQTICQNDCIIKNFKSIHIPGLEVDFDDLTAKDKRDISIAKKLGCNWIALSYVKNSKIIKQTRKLIPQDTGIIAKVENKSAIKNIKDIIQTSDAIMVARGDLGVEIGDAALVAVQKKLIARSRQLNKIVITATQMMESMISSPMPTRAEVMDVANAVLDGTDAVMLSAETAAGDFPEETVKAMANVCIGAESHPSVKVSKHRLDARFTSVEETIALSTMYAANHLEGVKAIIALTESGATPKLMSRISSSLPILGLSRHETTLAKMALYRGVLPIYFDSTIYPADELAQKALESLTTAGYLQSGDLVLMTKGDAMETIGGTNTCKVLIVA